MFAKSSEELLKICAEKGISIAEYTILEEMERTNASREEAMKNMKSVLDTMRSATDDARQKPVYSVSGVSGGNANKYAQYLKSNKSIAGSFISTAMAMALSCSEVNSAMGRIVACPTAGSCGIVPAALHALREVYKIDEESLIMGLFTASGVGIIIGENATFAGAEGGCQAECGSAAAMAAAMIVEVLKGSPDVAINAAAISLKNLLGLICDPVAGLVEIPCVKRNAIVVANSISSADLAMAGVFSYIPFDQVVSTMYKIGLDMPPKYRETAEGGLAITEKGLEIRKKVFGD